MKRMKKMGALLLALLLPVMMLTACGGSNSAKSEAAVDRGDYVVNDSATSNGVFFDKMDSAGDIAMEAPMEDGKVELTGQGISGVRENAKVIRRANMDMQTKDFDSATAALAQLVEDLEGYFESRDLYNRGSYRSGSFVVRVPVASFDTFCTQVGQLCHLTYFSAADQDISEQYYDTEARLTTQRTKLERLQELLRKAESMEDIITIESAISETELQIEYLTGSLRKYDSLVDYGTIHVNIDEVYRLSNEEEPVTTFGGRLSRAFTNGLKNIVDSMEDFAVFLAYNWLTLLVLLGAAVLVVRVVVKSRKKRRAKLDAAKEKKDE